MPEGSTGFVVSRGSGADGYPLGRFTQQNAPEKYAGSPKKGEGFIVVQASSFFQGLVRAAFAVTTSGRIEKGG